VSVQPARSAKNSCGGSRSAEKKVASTCVTGSHGQHCAKRGTHTWRMLPKSILRRGQPSGVLWSGAGQALP
jgi:hypothetical protein